MRVPFKPVYLKKAYKKFMYIIIHDYSCKFGTLNKVDTKGISVQDVRNYNWIWYNEFELPYHFICEKIGQDFETVMCRPLSYYCEYEDIPSVYLPSVHIAIAGNYNVIAPEQRAYQQIGYRSIASIMRWFSIPISNIKMHWEVSADKTIHCPGDLFDKDKFLANIRSLILVKR